MLRGVVRHGRGVRCAAQRLVIPSISCPSLRSFRATAGWASAAHPTAAATRASTACRRALHSSTAAESAWEVDAELVLDLQCHLGEGPIWNAETSRLLTVDVSAGSIFDIDVSDPVQVHRQVTLDEDVGTVVPVRGMPDHVVVATESGVYLVGLDSGAKERQLMLRQDHERCAPGVESVFNDGKCDATGRLFAGTKSAAGVRGECSLFRIDARSGAPQADVTVALGGVSTSNGIDWSPDGRFLYYADSPTQQVDRMPWDEGAGAVDAASRTTLFALDAAAEGTPDGLCVDEEGALWLAHWDGWRVTKRDPIDGSVLGTVHVPVAYTTACWFGGPQLDDLFITTAQWDKSAEELAAQPHAGSLFVARGVGRGRPGNAMIVN